MDVYEGRGRLDVIAEEVNASDDEGHQAWRSRPLVDIDGVENRARVQPGSSFQRFSVGTDESLHFDPCMSEEDEESADGGVFADSEGLVDGKRALTESDPPDVFCADCQTPTHAFQKSFGPHKSHRVILMSAKNVSKTKGKLEEKITQMENFASNLEEIFITVEDNFGRQEQNLEQHYNDVLQTLSQRYEESASALENEKKVKLESLYSQLICCGKMMDTTKELIEVAQKLYRTENKCSFLRVSFHCCTTKFYHSFMLYRCTVSPFETLTADFSDIKHMMDSINIVPAPSAPVMNPQIPNSASLTSLRVCWSLFSDDTVEYYELYSRPISEDMSVESGLEASMVKVKETHYTVTELVPNAQYEFWVTATNTTGISPSSEKAVYMTVPAPPIIKPQECTSCPDAALIRWDSGNTNPVDSYTVELAEIGPEVGESSITESIVAIPTCECLIQLQPGTRYLVYVRAVNIGGPSERSQPFTVVTIGTFFHLLEDTAHPCLSISEDGFTMFYTDDELPLSEMAFTDESFARCVAVLGDLIPIRSKHYWEVEVDPNTEYRIGVAYEDTQRNAYLGGNNASWCMRHVLTPSRHKYEFLHNGWTPDIRITRHPLRIGVALDYDHGKLSFFNADLEQHLYTFHCQFLHFVHPCFALDNPGALTLVNGTEAPNYTKFT
uniref:Fibronectin type III and SPRY domain containing 2 n=1 Tax=Denticeps clupeoides TaxID=299321 RepID=A0AAY4DFI8_9TELE